MGNAPKPGTSNPRHLPDSDQYQCLTWTWCPAAEGLWWQHPPPTHFSPKISPPHPQHHNLLPQHFSSSPQNPQVPHGRATEAWLGVTAGDSGSAASEPGAGLLFHHHSSTDQLPGSQQPHLWLILPQIWPLFRPGSQLGTGASACSISEGWF